MAETAAVRFTELSLQNFKTFRSYRVRLSRTNILVGPNNSGKSTIIGCFRALAAAIRTAGARAPQIVRGVGGGATTGWEVRDSGIPISLENASTDYSNEPAVATFTLSNRNRMVLIFRRERPCTLLVEVRSGEGGTIRAPRDFRHHFPVSVGAVPTLGVVEHEEEFVTLETVERNLASHRASRNFRSYWLYHRNEPQFEEFKAGIRDSWPGMEVDRPERDDTVVHFWFLEDRMTRELYWLGYGFQIWCQLLTHIIQHKHDTILVLDEPETYLHPDVQRQLLGMLRDTGVDVLLATHSTELLSEAEPSEILIVDKRRTAARRVSTAQGVQEAYEKLGSRKTYDLSSIARSRRGVFVEGDDFRLLRRMAAAIGLRRLAASSGVSAIELGGHRPEHATSMAAGIREAIGDSKFGVILDRDARCSEEVLALQESLTDLDFVHVFERKELENYLLDPVILDRAISAALTDRLSRGARAPATTPKAADLFMQATEPLRLDVQSDYVGSWVSYHQDVLRSRKDVRTLQKDATAAFEKDWAAPETRIRIAPGKDVLHAINRILQEAADISLSAGLIADNATRIGLPPEIFKLLTQLDGFRSTY